MGMAESAARFGNVLLQVLLVRALDPARYGVFAYAYSLFLVVIPLTSLGIAEAFIREGAIRGERIGAVLSEHFSLRALSAGVAAAVIVAVSTAGGADSPVILAVGAYLLFRSLTSFLATMFRAREVIWKEFALRSVETAVIVAVGAAALALRWSLPRVVWALAAAGAACLAIAVVGFRTLLPDFAWRLPKRAIRRISAAAPYGLPAVAGGWLLRIDVVFFERMGGDAARTGYFASAVNLVLGAALVPVIAAAAVYPTLARRGAGRGEGVGRLLAAFAAVGAVMSVALWASAVPVVRIAYGAGYAPASRWLAAAAPFLAFLSPAIFAATVLAARGRTGLLSAALLVPLAGVAVSDALCLPSRASAVVPLTIAWEAAACACLVSFCVVSNVRSRQT
jgi:O-antigen/teichoic acid export membrane protein